MIVIIFPRGRMGVCPNGAIRYYVLMLTNPHGPWTLIVYVMQGLTGQETH